MYHKVFLVNYKTGLKKAKYHQAIFISSKEESKEVSEGDRRGSVFQVLGPLKRGRNKEFTFDTEENKAPARSELYRSMKHIGRIESSNKLMVWMICSDVQPPLVPGEYEGESPNCCDWVNNVLYRLSESRVVEFRDDFKVPSREINMVSKASKPPDKSSSSESSEKDSYLKPPKELSSKHGLRSGKSPKASSSKNGTKATKSVENGSFRKSSKASSSKHHSKNKN